MAKVYGYAVDPDVQALLDRSLMPNWTGDTFQLILKNRSLSRAKLAKVAGRSIIPLAGAEWRTLDTAYKNLYSNSAFFNGLSKWNIGVMQYAGGYNFLNPQFSIPVSPQAGKAGCMVSPVLGKTFEIRQGHPLAYYVAQKVVGTKSRYMPALVNEHSSPSVGVSFNFFMGGITSGEFVNPNNFIFGTGGAVVVIVRFYRNTFRGNTFAQFSHTLPFQAFGQYFNVGFLKPNTYNAGYDIIFRMVNVQGMFLFDTITAEQDSFNYARDFRCKNVNRRFTGHLSSVMPSWEIFTNSAGGTLSSRFYQEEPL